MGWLISLVLHAVAALLYWGLTGLPEEGPYSIEPPDFQCRVVPPGPIFYIGREPDGYGRWPIRRCAHVYASETEGPGCEFCERRYEAAWCRSWDVPFVE